MPGDGQIIAGLLTGAWRANCPAVTLDAAIADRIVPVLMSTNAGPMLFQRVGMDGAADHGADLLDIWRMAQLNAEIQSHVIAEVSVLLADAGIKHAVLKGGTVARFYHDPALRPFGDVDVLVHPAQRAAALDVLLPLSFARDQRARLPVDADQVFSLDWHYPAALSKIDLHHDLARFHLPDSGAVLARAESADFAGQAVPVLAAADMFQVICLHTLINGCWRPVWLTDIAAFVDAHPADFFQGLVDVTSPLILHWIAICIGLARDLLGLETGHLPAGLGVQVAPPWLVARVLANWQLHFSDFHNKTDIAHLVRRRPWQLPGELAKRWPDPVRAVFERGRPFPSRHPMADQVLFYLAQLRHGLAGG